MSVIHNLSNANPFKKTVVTIMKHGFWKKVSRDYKNSKFVKWTKGFDQDYKKVEMKRNSISALFYMFERMKSFLVDWVKRFGQ